LRTEHGFTGGYTIIKDYIREREQRSRPLCIIRPQIHGWRA